MDNNRRELDNSLYLQLKKDMKKKKNQNRIYVPVEIFGDVEDVDLKKEPTFGQKLISMLNAVVK